MTEVYEGPVSVYDKKADGTPLLIGKGDRKGEPFYKISFKVNGQYVNLMDFQGITGGHQGMFHVEYYQKFDPKTGQPELYNDKPQYNLESIMPLGAPQMPQNGAPGTQGSPTPAVSTFEREKNESIRSQTALKVAGECYASELSADKSKKFEHERFDVIYTAVKATLDGKSELDVALDAADKAGLAEAGLVKEKPVEMPGPDAEPLPEPPEEDFGF